MLNLKEKGELGEYLAYSWLYSQKLDPVKVSKKIDIEAGVDLYSLNKEGMHVKIDVKNTLDIYFANLDNETGKLLVRHPFRENSRATDFLILQENSDETSITVDVLYFGKIEKYFSETIFKDWTCYKKFTHCIQSLNNSHWSDKAVSKSQFLFSLKKELLAYVKEEYTIVYSDPNYPNCFLKVCLKRPSKQEEDVHIQSDKIIQNRTIENTPHSDVNI